MSKPFITHFTVSRRGHVALTAIACLIALTTSAQAGTPTSATSPVEAVPPAPAFTITAMKAASGAAPRVFSIDAAGEVVLARPVAGDPRQAWAVVGGASPVPLASFARCLERTACPFTTSRPTTRRTFVNQASGLCLQLAEGSGARRPRLTTRPCDAGAVGGAPQRFHWNFGDEEVAAQGVPPRYTALGTQSAGRLRCITSSAAGTGSAVVGAPCTNRLRWEQQVRFTPVPRA